MEKAINSQTVKKKMNEETALKQLKELEKHGKKADELRLAAEEWKNDFEILISTIMSARTRDEVTIPVAEKLFQIYPTPEKLAKAKTEHVESIIRPVNFFRNKTKSIINCSKDLVKDYNGLVPRDIEQLIKLPGVGRKTANVFLAENKKQALPVDTHVFYISKKLDWAKGNTPYKVEFELTELFSKKHWNKINSILVRFGKTYTSRKKKDALLEQIKKIK